MRKKAVQIEQYDRFLLKKRFALVMVAVITLLIAMMYMSIGSMKISLLISFTFLWGKLKRSIKLRL